jgi:flagellar M-ring protein FliF
VGLIGFFVFLVVKLSQPQLTVLFTDLEVSDANAIVNKLEGMNVPLEMRQDGQTILVPKDQVLRLRMQLAEQGLPQGGAVGYEIFDKSDGLGATSFVQNINRLRALEGELARSIRSLERVQAARVHLVLPTRQLFAKESPEASASIMLKVTGALDQSQIRAIQHLAASAVEGLKAERVSIVDERGQLLASGDNDAAGLIAIDERNRMFERRLQREVEDLVTSVVGNGRARVRVTAELDYSKITETSDRFDPEGRVIRSQQVREEASSAATAGGAPVTVANELPAATPQQGDNAGGSRDQARKTEEVVNYEISRTTKTEVSEAGRIKRLSVAVLVDGLYTKSADGKVSYSPRPQAQLDEIASLVRSAIGLDDGRGDQVHVANLPFAEASAAPFGAEADASSLGGIDYFRLAEILALVLVSGLILLLVIRPLVRRIVTPERPLAIPDLRAPSERATQLPSFEGASQSTDLVPVNAPPSKASEIIKFAKVTGEVQAAAVRELIDNNPQEAASILRQWLQQPT